AIVELLRSTRVSATASGLLVRPLARRARRRLGEDLARHRTGQLRCRALRPRLAIERQGEREDAPLTLFAVGPDHAAVLPKDVLGDRQPDAAPLAGAGHVSRLVVAIEDPIQLVARDADAAVLDLHAGHILALAIRLDQDFAAVAVVLDRVGEEVE